MHISEQSNEPLKIYTFCTCFEVYVTLFELKDNGTDSITVYAYECGWKAQWVTLHFPTNSTVNGIKWSENRIGTVCPLSRKASTFYFWIIKICP